MGQWVRLFAVKPLATRRRRQLLQERRQLLAGNGTQAAGAFLPLTPALLEIKRQAEALGLDLPEHSLSSGSGSGSGSSVGGGGDRVVAAGANGSLDAYLYGNNAANSGSRQFSGDRVRFLSRCGGRSVALHAANAAQALWAFSLMPLAVLHAFFLACLPASNAAMPASTHASLPVLQGVCGGRRLDRAGAPAAVRHPDSLAGLGVPL